MKKMVFLFSIITFLGVSNNAFAYDLQSISDITPVQKNEISKIQHDFQYQANDIDAKITTYKNKIEQIKNDEDKTEAQKSLLIGAYERNLETLKAQKKALETKADNSYKAVMNPEQYNQYKAQPLEVQDAFKKFLEK